MQLQLSVRACLIQLFVGIMSLSLGVSTGLVSLCAFISCFIALNMLGRIEHIKVDAAVHVNVKVPNGKGFRCNSTFIVENTDAPHLTYIELFSIKWIVFITLVYSFLVMFLVRAYAVSNFHMNFVFSNTMMFIGGGLTTALLASILLLNDRAPFTDVWCNELIIYIMYFIALNTGVSVVYFLAYSCKQYFTLPPPDRAV